MSHQLRRALPAILLSMTACATARTDSSAAHPPPGEVVRVEMEPLRIEAQRDGEGLHLEAYDAAELFEQAGAALSAGRHGEAVGAYDRLLKEFPGSRFSRAALYNSGLALQGKKDWSAAADRFRALADADPSSPDAKDALFQLGACHAELGNWPASAQAFATLLERTDLSVDDRVEAFARRGFAQFNLKDIDTAERTFRAAPAYVESVKESSRLETDFYLGLCRYHLGQIPHERFRRAPLRLPQDQLGKDLDAKAGLLLAAQREYIDTIKLGHPGWASAAGYQIGALYEELHEAISGVPVPSELAGDDKAEARGVYLAEVHARIRVLLEKAVRVHEQNLLMLERLGVQNEWGEKSKASFAKIQDFLAARTPSVREGGRDHDARPAPEPSPEPPPPPSRLRPSSPAALPPSSPVQAPHDGRRPPPSREPSAPDRRVM